MSDQHLVYYSPAGIISFQAGSNTDSYVEFRTLGSSWERCRGSRSSRCLWRGEEMSARWRADVSRLSFHWPSQRCLTNSTQRDILLLGGWSLQSSGDLMELSVVFYLSEFLQKCICWAMKWMWLAAQIMWWEFILTSLTFDWDFGILANEVILPKVLSISLCIKHFKKKQMRA